MHHRRPAENGKLEVNSAGYNKHRTKHLYKLIYGTRMLNWVYWNNRESNKTASKKGKENYCYSTISTFWKCEKYVGIEEMV